jgi:TolA-binding protein
MEADYRQVCTAYELGEAHAVERLRAYLDTYPDTPHANRIYTLIASSYYFDEAYDKALAMFGSAQLDMLPDNERDDMTYRKAICYLKTGHLTEAAVWLETVRSTGSRYDTDCTYYLSYVRYAQQRYDEALTGFLAVQNDRRYNRTAPIYIGEIYLQQKKYAEAAGVARNYLSQYSDADEQHAQMQCVLGEAYYREGNYHDAMVAFERYLAGNPAAPRRDALYMLGLAYYQNAVYSKAVSTLGEVTAAADDALTQNAYLHIGLSYLQLSDKTRARMAFEQAAASDADRNVKEQAAYNYALSIHDTSYSAFGQSVSAFEKFLNDFPASRYADKVSSYLVEVYMNTRSYEAALQSINRIAHPGATILDAKQRILFRLGTQAFTNADYAQAGNYFDQTLQAGSNRQVRADALYWRGETYYRQGRMQEAGNNFNDYLRLTPDRNGETYALAYYNLGYIAFHSKAYTSAQNYFQRYLQSEKGKNPAALADAYNRLGDCALEARRFDEAKQYYTRSESMNAGTGDYSLYQLALVAGLQKDYAGKVNLLNRMESRYPSSPYVINALYEKGRSYVQNNQNAQAIATFQTLLANYPSNAVSRKAAAEVGLLYYQDGDYNRAIEAYRQVIERYPGSEEARLALRDLKSIYVDANRVDEYATLTASLPGAERLEAGEQDTLTYLAAEKIVQKGDKMNGEASLRRYLESFPNGAFAEEALVIHSELLFDEKRYADALDDYKLLKVRATTAERRQLAATGWLRCAVLLNNDAETVDAATGLLAESKLTPELTQEAHYYRGKAYLNRQETESALNDLRIAEKDTRTRYGAEARYLVARQLYLQRDYAAAEKELLDFIDQSTPHTYWLARGFILLSDVYVAMDRKLDARQYLLSLQQNYHADDDIAQLITERLSKL